MERPFIAENAREFKRLRSLVDRLTEDDLNLAMEEGWTVAAALAHLAFWDRRSLVLMRKWSSSEIEPSPIDIDVANDSLLPLLLAIPPRAAADLAVSSAGAIDRELETASSDLIASIESLGEKFRLYRSFHRKMHLDQIEGRLKISPS